MADFLDYFHSTWFFFNCLFHLTISRITEDSRPKLFINYRPPSKNNSFRKVGMNKTRFYDHSCHSNPCPQAIPSFLHHQAL